MKNAAIHCRASTLLIALWAVFVIAAAVAMWSGEIGGAIEADRVANRALEARALAHSGLAVALHPGVSLTSPYLHREFPGVGAYSVSIKSEGGRIHLNYLLAGADPEKVAFLKRVLAARGLTLRERERLTDCLLDWVNPSTGMRRPNGRAEGPDYQPPHRPLRSLDEVAQVEGSGPLVARANWKDDFTLWSAGPLDIESISAEWLALVPGIDEMRARSLVKLREERKRRGGGDARKVYQSFEEAADDLGLPPEKLAVASTFLGFRDPAVRITSIGASGGVRWRVEAVARKSSSKFILWTENQD